MPPGLTGSPACLQVSEQPVLVVQPVSGLHFPATEALREVLVSWALEGMWARTGLAAVTPERPLSRLYPACSQDPEALPSAVGEELAH